MIYFTFQNDVVVLGVFETEQPGNFGGTVNAI